MTMGRRTSAARFRHGHRNVASGLNTFSQESRSKTLTWNGSTGRFVTNGYPSIIGSALKRFRTSPPSGCGPTTMIARTWPWAVSPRSSIWPRLHNRSTFRAGGNWGDYPAKLPFLSASPSWPMGLSLLMLLFAANAA